VRRADHSSRGVLPIVMCPMSVIAEAPLGETKARNRVEAPQKYKSERIFSAHSESWLSYMRIEKCLPTEK
jgi:hypothetical protein